MRDAVAKCFVARRTKKLRRSGKRMRRDMAARLDRVMLVVFYETQ